MLDLGGMTPASASVAPARPRCEEAGTDLPQVLESLLEHLWSQGGTDLILSVDSPPRARIDGVLAPVGTGPLDRGEIASILDSLLSDADRATLAASSDVDFSFSFGEAARVRGNAFFQRGSLAVALRLIPNAIPTLEEVGAPEALGRLAALDRGLVLVTGPTGSGKSTTLAALVGRINATRCLHVLTIEDPIEYLHVSDRSLVSQREIGVDAPSFERALRAAFREDPDVLLIGEMRDLDSIQAALTLAETGHLVFATLHTNDAVQAVDRIVDVFPTGRQEQVRVQFASTLAAVVAQRLLPRRRAGLVATFEVLLATNAVRNLIRENKSNQLRNVMTTSRQEGMQTLEMDLARLVSEGIVDDAHARSVSAHPRELELFGGVGL